MHGRFRGAVPRFRGAAPVPKGTVPCSPTAASPRCPRKSGQSPCLRGVLLSAAIMASVVQVKYTGLIFAAVWGVFLAVDLLRRCGWRSRAAMVGRSRRPVGRDGVALVRLCLSGHGKPVLPLLEPMVSVAVLGRRLCAAAGFRGELQAVTRHRRCGGVSLGRHVPYHRFRGRIRRTSGILGAGIGDRVAFWRGGAAALPTGTWRLSPSP